MKIKTIFKVIGLFAGIATMVGSLSAATIRGINGNFSMDERVSGSGVEYRLDLHTSKPIFAVAISFVADGTNQGEPYGQMGMLQNAWTAEIIKESVWNDANTYYRLGTGPVIQTSSLGNFDSLFGTVDNMVAFYYQFRDFVVPFDETLDSDEADWATDLATFSRNAFVPSSEVIIIDGAGDIAGGSLAVPEPSSIFLFGISGLVIVGRRRR